MSKKHRQNIPSAHRQAINSAGKTFNALIDSINQNLEEGRLQDAEIACRQLLARQPNNSRVVGSLAQILNRAGRPAEAADVLEQTLKRKADARLYNTLGIARRALGDLEGALSAFSKAVKLQPNMAEALANVADIKTFSKIDADIAAMEKLLHRGKVSDMGKIRLHFALAKAYDDLGEFDTAFSHLATGNRLKRNTIVYDVGHQDLLVDQIVSVFSKRFLRRFGPTRTGIGAFFGALKKSENTLSDAHETPLIFIVGMPRSGTTLIEQILSSHSEVCGAGERNDLKDRVVLSVSKINPGATGFPYNVVNIDQDAMHRLGDEYMNSMRAYCPDAKRIVDKTPMNFLFIGLISMMWPAAKVINCLRDPVATCFSCYTKLFSGDQPFAYDLVDLGRYYRSYRRLLRHWQSVLPGFVLDVRYEDLVSNLESETRRLLSFCQLEWEPECLRFHENLRPVLTASAIDVRRPIYGSAIKHWRHYEDHLGDLLDALSDA